MKQSPLLEFESSAFPVIPGEDQETNPEIYGKALAQWLAEQLRLSSYSAYSNSLLSFDNAGRP